jgi:hypothetical protein
MAADREKRFLVIYSGVLTAVFAGTVLWGCAAVTKKPRFDEIDVQRINVIEPDGTVRLVVANKARFPGSFFGGKEIPRTDRQTAGLLFVNDDGIEMGGLTFEGTKNKAGQIVANGHLSFDQYDQDQVFAIDAGQAGTARQTMVVISDRGDYPLHELFDELARANSLPPEQRQAATKKFVETHPGDHPRVLLGRAADRSAILRMKDTEGRDRIVMKVLADGAPVLQFLDENGRVVEELPRVPSGGR